MDDYKGFKRFTSEWSKKTKAFSVKFWLFMAVFFISFTLIFYAFSDKEKLSNAAVYGVAITLQSFQKGSLSLKYVTRNGGKEKATASEIVADSYLKKSLNDTLLLGVILAPISLVFGLLALTIFSRYFRGFQQEASHKKIHIRGAKYTESENLLSYIKKEGMETPYPLGNIPWIADKVRRHLSISGDTGVGKSQALMNILEVIRSRNEKAMVLDKNGEMLSHFYDPETDIILSPFDDRSHNWTPYLEGCSEVDLERMAMSFIPTENTRSDDHWPEASVTVFSALLYQVSKQGGFNGGIDEVLTKLLERTKMVETNLLGQQKEVVKYGLMELVDGTLASLVIDPDAPEHAMSVIASIVPKIRSLRYLRGMENRENFSIQEWVKNSDKKGWVFIRVNENEMDAVGPLVTAWFDTFIKSVLSLPKSDDRVIWNIIDELQSLSKINSLSKALNEGRKHGLRNILGFTSIDELFHIYGDHKAKAMMSQCNTKLVFQTAEYGAAKWNSELLGMEEVITENESQTFGDRDSLGLNDQRNEKTVVMPSEIQNLENLKAYLKFSGNYPATKITSTYKSRPVVAETSVPRDMPEPLIVKQKVIKPDDGQSGGEGSPTKPQKPDSSRFRVDEPLI